MLPLRSFFAVVLAGGWVGLASAQPISFLRDDYRPATMQGLAKPRAVPGQHVVRVNFPTARREARPETQRAVQAWIQRHGLAPQLARFMTREYQVEGAWVVFLEWEDLRQVLKPGEPVRLYLHDIGAAGATPSMAALVVHQGWLKDISQLDETILAHIARRNMVPVSDNDNLAAQLGISGVALYAQLESMWMRRLIQRGPSGDRLKPGQFIALTLEGGQVLHKATGGDVLGIYGWLKFDGRARELMGKIQECLRAQGGPAGAAGFPVQLSQLGPSGSRCLAEAEAADMGSGYRVSYLPGVPDGSGRVHIYSLCAAPALPGASGFSSYAGDEQAPGVWTGGSCASAYGSAIFRKIKHCLVAYAAANPTRGYPADFAPLGPAGNGCLLAVTRPTPERDWFSARGVNATDDRHYAYVPGKPLADGRIASFEVVSQRKWLYTVVEEMMTSEGTLHAAERRTPTRADPAPDAMLERIRARVKDNEASMKVMDRRCVEGSMPDCGELAHLELRYEKYGRTDKLWDQACAGGHEESCLFSLKYLGEIEARWKKSCDLNERLGCETMHQHRASRVRSEAQTLKRGCERQEQGDCERLVEMAAQLRSGRLLPLPKYQRLDRFAPPGHRP